VETYRNVVGASAPARPKALGSEFSLSGPNQRPSLWTHCTVWRSSGQGRRVSLGGRQRGIGSSVGAVPLRKLHAGTLPVSDHARLSRREDPPGEGVGFGASTGDCVHAQGTVPHMRRATSGASRSDAWSLLTRPPLRSAAATMRRSASTTNCVLHSWAAVEARTPGVPPFCNRWSCMACTESLHHVKRARKGRSRPFAMRRSGVRIPSAPPMNRA
jgi:hypothetical protein